MKEKEEIVEINNGESHRVLELAMEAGRQRWLMEKILLK